MKKLFYTSISITLAVVTSLTFGAYTAGASSIQDGINAAHGEGQPTELFGDGGVITTITNILLFIIGALSVIMIIWGGIRYTTSGGSSSAVTSAKNTIMYAIIGLIIAFLAFAIVNWVLNAVTPGGTGGFTNV